MQHNEKQGALSLYYTVHVKKFLASTCGYLVKLKMVDSISFGNWKDGVYFSFRFESFPWEKPKWEVPVGNFLRREQNQVQFFIVVETSVAPRFS